MGGVEDPWDRLSQELSHVTDEDFGAVQETFSRGPSMREEGIITHFIPKEQRVYHTLAADTALLQFLRDTTKVRSIDIDDSGIIIRGTEQHVADFVEQLRGTQSFQKDVYIFIDESNILCNKGGVVQEGRPLDKKSLMRVLCRGRALGEGAALVWGSYSSRNKRRNEAKKREWAEAGAVLDLSERTASNRETGVDEAIHGAINQRLIDLAAQRRFDRTRGAVFIIVTGDGNNNHNRITNFVKCVENCLKNDVDVEMWSWRASCSTAYKKLHQERKIVLRFLDSYLEDILVHPDTPIPRICMLYWCGDDVEGMVHKRCGKEILLCHRCLARAWSCPACKKPLQGDYSLPPYCRQCNSMRSVDCGRGHYSFCVYCTPGTPCCWVCAKCSAATPIGHPSCNSCGAPRAL